MKTTTNETLGHGMTREGEERAYGALMLHARGKAVRLGMSMYCYIKVCKTNSRRIAGMRAGWGRWGLVRLIFANGFRLGCFLIALQALIL